MGILALDWLWTNPFHRKIYHNVRFVAGFSGGSVGKVSACNVGDLGSQSWTRLSDFTSLALLQNKSWIKYNQTPLRTEN